ncbi:MAG: hypothetical protein J5493_02810 [Lachnospiraceae bacterium]|nr:hypothetical protein [Lachnospiraceae bacterium]
MGEKTLIICEDLTIVYFPTSLLSIGSYAFMFCDNLSYIYFDGSARQ